MAALVQSTVAAVLAQMQVRPSTTASHSDAAPQSAVAPAAPAVSCSVPRTPSRSGATESGFTTPAAATKAPLDDDFYDDFDLDWRTLSNEDLQSLEASIAKSGK